MFPGTFTINNFSLSYFSLLLLFFFFLWPTTGRRGPARSLEHRRPLAMLGLTLARQAQAHPNPARLPATSASRRPWPRLAIGQKEEKRKKGKKENFKKILKN